MLSQSDIDKRIERHRHEYDEFANEVTWVHRELISLHYPVAAVEPTYGFHHSCHAYMMLTFAWIDAVSAFWAGGSKKRNPTGTVAHRTWTSQTERMVAFLDAYHSKQTNIHRVSVEMWRHTLMHESKPREIEDNVGQHYSWLLLWEMDASCHYTMIPASPPYSGNPYTISKIQIGLIPLITDMRRTFEDYWYWLRSDPFLQGAYANREGEIPSRTFIP